jgi:integrase
MQNGSVIRAERQRGPDVWEFRWREPGADGKRNHRRMILGSIEQLADETAARQAIATLRLDLNHGDAWLKTRSTTVWELAAHYRERELEPDTIWKTHSTKVTYEGYLNKWILPRWGKYPLVRVNAGEVELWLRSLLLAKSSCAKIRNLMSVLFNHGIRYEICNRNPIQLVRQSAKRKSVPVILSANEVQRLISVLGVRERTLVLLAFGTGLRMSELFGLKWHDIDFQTNEISVTRSIVFQVVGPCKTEASQKPVPLDPRLQIDAQRTNVCDRTVSSISAPKSASSVCSTLGIRSSNITPMPIVWCPPADCRSITLVGFHRTLASFFPSRCSERFFAVSLSRL